MPFDGVGESGSITVGTKRILARVPCRAWPVKPVISWEFRVVTPDWTGA
jgi:hypothetical protein